jgi:sugar (pentulose or hexulose) kinase
MLPIDIDTGGYDLATTPRMIGAFDDLVAGHGLPRRMEELLPKIRRATEPAGTLTNAAGLPLRWRPGRRRPRRAGSAVR